MQIRILKASDAPEWQAVRLRGLLETPSAFASSYEEEAPNSIETVASRMEPRPGAVRFGAFSLDPARMIGTVGVLREEKRKLAHKAVIWGMYVIPEERREGVGMALLVAAMQHAKSEMAIQELVLGVNARNLAALRLYERLGFRRFGLEENYMILDGEPQDEIMMKCRLA